MRFGLCELVLRLDRPHDPEVLHSAEFVFVQRSTDIGFGAVGPSTPCVAWQTGRHSVADDAMYLNPAPGLSPQRAPTARRGVLSDADALGPSVQSGLIGWKAT